MTIENNNQKKIYNIVTGGAGFIGSHLIEKLIGNGEHVYCIDNLLTGELKNISHLLELENFQFINHDVCSPLEIDVKVDKIWHLACPASPSIYQKDPILTAKINFLGTLNMLQLAKKFNSKFFLASSSEIYGNSTSFNDNGESLVKNKTSSVRSCYYEGKRIAETLCFDFKREFEIDVKVGRIFNTYGPKLNPGDGRVISNFIYQALSGQPLTIYGDGTQTRSFCYVQDITRAIVIFMNSKHSGPFNLGHSQEITINDLASLIRGKIDLSVPFEYKKLPEDDPIKRRPICNKAHQILQWFPNISLEEGLDRNISFFKKEYF